MSVPELNLVRGLRRLALSGCSHLMPATLRCTAGIRIASQDTAHKPLRDAPSRIFETCLKGVTRICLAGDGFTVPKQMGLDRSCLQDGNQTGCFTLR